MVYFQFFTVHIVNIHNNHQHMHTGDGLNVNRNMPEILTILTN